MEEMNVAKDVVKVAEVAVEVVPHLTKGDFAVVGGIFGTGVAVGVVADRFVVPFITKQIDKIKGKRAAKKEDVATEEPIEETVEA